MRYSFTGPTDIAREDVEYIEDVIRVLPDHEGDCYITGAAHGVDTAACMAAGAHHLDAGHVIIVPGEGKLWHNDAHVAASAGWASIVNCWGNYMMRNDELVRQCDVLIAFPPTHREELRSGTWATVRRATKAGKQVVLLPLNLKPEMRSDLWAEIL